MSSLMDRLSGQRRGSRWMPLLPRLSTRPLATAMLTWWERMQQRRALQRLDDRLLNDIGLTRADVDCEPRKPISLRNSAGLSRSRAATIVWFWQF
jgi:uncharacterized protein YjiS (DUF1127 family)